MLNLKGGFYMKKSIFVFLSLVLSSMVFAKETKTYITAAYNFGMFTERTDQAQTKLLTNGFDLSVSGYFNENWGIYINTDYNFIDKATVYSGGISITTTSSDWDFSMLLSAIIGPTYKFNINDNFEILSALGFHLAQYSLRTKYVGTINYSFGIGGDIGIRYLPTKHFYLTAGSLFSHDFYYKGEINTAYGSTKNSDSYNLGSIRPYIGIGFTLTEIIK